MYHSTHCRIWGVQPFVLEFSVIFCFLSTYAQALGHFSVLGFLFWHKQHLPHSFLYIIYQIEFSDLFENTANPILSPHRAMLEPAAWASAWNNRRPMEMWGKHPWAQRGPDAPLPARVADPTGGEACRSECNTGVYNIILKGTGHVIWGTSVYWTQLRVTG